MSDAPVPGWYPNPTNQVAEWRWWNGSTWTADVAPRTDLPVRRSLEWSDARSAYRGDHLRTDDSPNTVWIWLLAFSLPLTSAIAVVAVVAVVLLGRVSPYATDVPFYGAAAYGVGLVVLWIFAGLDGRALRLRGFDAPSILWMLLLPPLVYFVVRARKLKVVGARSRGPEIALLIIYGLQIVGYLASVFLTMARNLG